VNDGDSLFVALLCAAIVCVLVILVDGWFLRPQRDPGATSVAEPLLPRIAGYALVALALGMLWRLFRYEAVDFSFMLVLVGAISGAIWGLDQAFFARRRRALAARAGTPPERVREPVAVEYARSFFPVILLVLVIRSFVFEPFRIPSDSMMPTLFDGDFIFVSKYSYGLRLPVTNTLIVPTGTPQRGDVIVFRLPPNPKINYIKRLVGLPGETISIGEDQHARINGQRLDASTPHFENIYGFDTNAPPREGSTGQYNGHVLEPASMYLPSAGSSIEIPPRHFVAFGDNTLNSLDSRYWGPLPEENVIGKSFFVYWPISSRFGWGQR
jgi:signal peptidase I